MAEEGRGAGGAIRVKSPEIHHKIRNGEQKPRWPLGALSPLAWLCLGIRARTRSEKMEKI